MTDVWPTRAGSYRHPTGYADDRKDPNLALRRADGYVYHDFSYSASAHLHRII